MDRGAVAFAFGSPTELSRPRGPLSPLTVSTLNALCFEFKIFRHPKASIPNRGIRRSLCKFPIPSRQFSQLVRVVHCDLPV